MHSDDVKDAVREARQGAAAGIVTCLATGAAVTPVTMFFGWITVGSRLDTGVLFVYALVGFVIGFFLGLRRVRAERAELVAKYMQAAMKKIGSS
jgi:hypothetical protein